MRNMLLKSTPKKCSNKKGILKNSKYWNINMILMRLVNDQLWMQDPPIS
jgi:hypothetical protein